MGFGYGPPTLATDEIVFCIDAGNTRCYTSGSTTATDIVGGNVLTIDNGVGATSNSWRFDKFIAASRSEEFV